MSEDASLDQFLGGGDDAEAGESDSSPDESDAGDDPAVANVESPDDSASADGTEPTDREPTDDGGVTPAVTTYAWSAEGAACSVCGEAVERRWQQNESLVCSDCKEWDRS
ncbi:DUF7573 domain-containing protein [Haloarcula amylovorans]|uniref:DUF7573 domain-containing protein n=1 Tax=Haloarcula amylovorans TaxID=2562280 RepID=UPI0010764304|nr:hypothetical protein [Halomicroarcula amylolytica]